MVWAGVFGRVGRGGNDPGRDRGGAGLAGNPALRPAGWKNLDAHRPNEVATPNIQHRTSRRSIRELSVGCSMLNVECFPPRLGWLAQALNKPPSVSVLYQIGRASCRERV